MFAFLTSCYALFTHELKRNDAQGPTKLKPLEKWLHPNSLAFTSHTKREERL
jgi:hypothetical protein